MSRMDEFREFVQKYPLLKESVKEKTRTWQEIYEEWVLYGENDEMWGDFKKTEVSQTPNVPNGINGIKNVFSNIKKMDPEKINNTLNSVQKVLQIAQTVAGPKSGAVNAVNAFSDWWD